MVLWYPNYLSNYYVILSSFVFAMMGNLSSGAFDLFFFYITDVSCLYALQEVLPASLRHPPLASLGRNRCTAARRCVLCYIVRQRLRASCRWLLAPWLSPMTCDTLPAKERRTGILPMSFICSRWSHYVTCSPTPSVTWWRCMNFPSNSQK